MRMGGPWHPAPWSPWPWPSNSLPGTQPSSCHMLCILDGPGTIDLGQCHNLTSEYSVIQTKRCSFTSCPLLDGGKITQQAVQIMYCHKTSMHCRYMDTQTKVEALQLIASLVRGLGDRDRNVVSIQTDALKAAVRSAKEAAASETCLAAAGDTCAP